MERGLNQCEVKQEAEGRPGWDPPSPTHLPPPHTFTQALEAARTRRKKDVNGNEVDADDDGGGGAGGPTQRGAKNGRQRHQDEDDRCEQCGAVSEAEWGSGRQVLPGPHTPC